MKQSSFDILPNIEYQKWAQLFSLVKKPNLLQSWFYGEAKLKSQDWKLERCVIFEGDQPIALVQVLYKKFFVIKLVRLNQGPLWMIETPSLEQIRGTLNVIKRYCNLKKGSVLSIAPNLINRPEYVRMLTELRFYKRKCMLYESGLINLNQSVLDLRLKLRWNWRNQLTFS